MSMKQLLISEIENKKVFEAKWDTECSECGQCILEGDDFYFFGEKQKVCSICYNQMMDDLEDSSL